VGPDSRLVRLVSEDARPLRIAVAGAGGRMGRTLIAAVQAAADMTLHAALDVAGSPAIGQSVATTREGRAIVAGSDLAAIDGADALIDFTRPAGTLAHLAAAVARKVPMVIGTTGFTEDEKARIADAAKRIPIVFAPNMSIGVNVTLRLLEVAARALDRGFDIEILEMHHRHKIDAPSGTALGMGEAIARAQGRALADAAVYAREGVTGERDPSSIGFAVLRGGDCVGEHTVIFAGTGERIEITHRATSRDNFASGALRAARYVAGRSPGLYGMNDVLGLA